MHRLIITFFISSLLSLFPLAAQDANPLLGMIGKESSDYFDSYEALCDSLFAGDSLSRVSLVKLFTEAAAADPSGEWDFDRRRIEGHVRFFESREGGYTPSGDYTADDFTADLLLIAGQAGKKGLRTIRLRALFNAAAVCRIFAHDYERAFRYYLEVAAELETMPMKEFPWKFYLYQEIADFYFSFREYKDATLFYRKVAESPDMAPKYNRQLYSALNGLGLCYRYDEQYSRSDSCFQRILDLTASSEEDKYVWEGIALGCIGTNHYLRGDTDKALAWMLPALQKMKRPNDDLFSSNLAATVANIYLLRNDLSNGTKYLTLALRYYRRSRIPDKNSHLLEVMARYHTLRGDSHQASAYLDSTLRAKDKEQESYSGLVLRRVEQQLRSADRRLHERELDAEKLRVTFYRHTVFWVSLSLAVILILLLLLGFYYRRTRQAYHELVLRSQQWAGVVPAEKPWEADDESDEGDEVSDKVDEGEVISSRLAPDVPVSASDALITAPDAPITASDAHITAPDALVTAPDISVNDADISVNDAGVFSPNITASTDVALSTNTLATAPDEETLDKSDRFIMQKMEQLIVHDCFYKRADLTLDTLVVKTGLNRNYLSGALNRCVGKNFNAYVNEYRVKEAIRLMSESANAAYTIEDIAIESGFNDRINFYRIFKKLTGLSPTDFRRNLNLK